MCRDCELRGKTWNGSDPVCAFDNNGNLHGGHNWNCATLNELRETILNITDYESHIDKMVNGNYLYLDYQYSNDQHSVHIVFEMTIMFMTWYKSRGSIEYIYIHENYDMSDELFITILIDNLNKLLK